MITAHHAKPHSIISGSLSTSRLGFSRMPTPPRRCALAPRYLKGLRTEAFYTSLPPEKTGFTQGAAYNCWLSPPFLNAE